MQNVISASFGELALKGLNRKYFEDRLSKQIKKNLIGHEYENIFKEQGKIYIEHSSSDSDSIVEKVRRVFGIVWISKCIKVEKDFAEIYKATNEVVSEYLSKNSSIKTFKVETNRADKQFPKKSPEISREVGAYILKNFSSLEVDVHNPDFTLYIDIKQNAYVYIERVKGLGGLPTGTTGRGLLLLSGGIDSPVAGYMMAKRGMIIYAVHFHSYPFTSDRAEEKVKDLAKIVATYSGDIQIHSINLLPIQKEINEKCPEAQMTIIARRFMTKIAERIARELELDALITGENLGQVASQTIEGISVVNSSVDLPILRPLVGFDKVDIIEIAKKIGTYETSILPFEDCCTVFLPKHPVTHPKLEKIIESEKKLDEETLIQAALENKKVYTV